MPNFREHPVDEPFNQINVYPEFENWIERRQKVEKKGINKNWISIGRIRIPLFYMTKRKICVSHHLLLFYQFSIIKITTVDDLSMESINKTKMWLSRMSKVRIIRK